MTYVVEFTSWTMADGTHPRGYLQRDALVSLEDKKKGLLPVPNSMLSPVLTSFSNAFGYVYSTVQRIREDSLTDGPSFLGLGGGTPGPGAGNHTITRRLSDILHSPGDHVGTPYGEGTVQKHRVEDGIVEIQFLHFTATAYLQERVVTIIAKKRSLSLDGGALSFLSGGGDTSDPTLVEGETLPIFFMTPMGEGELLEKRDDGIYVIRLKWNLAGESDALGYFQENSVTPLIRDRSLTGSFWTALGYKLE